MTAFIDFKQIFAIYQQTIMFSLENTNTKPSSDIYILQKNIRDTSYKVKIFIHFVLFISRLFL